MTAGSSPKHSRRRLLLLGVAALLCASALLAIGILLLGRFGRTEGRILGTTALLAGYALVSLPAAMLFDRRRLTGLATAIVVLAVAAAALATWATWSNNPGESLGKSVGTATIVLVATVQTAALELRRGARDPGSVRILFAASIGLAALVATLLTIALWSNDVGSAYARALGSLVVLDLLVAALQPILARARPEQPAWSFRLRLEGGGTADLTVEAPDLSAAAAKALRAAESGGRRVSALELPDRSSRTSVQLARQDEEHGGERPLFPGHAGILGEGDRRGRDRTPG